MREMADDDDPEPLRAVLACYVANLLDGDRVWMFLVGGSGMVRRNDCVRSAACRMSHGVEYQRTSGAAQRHRTQGRAKDASGGLLQRIPQAGVCCCSKTSAASRPASRSACRGALGLREMYDGRWDRLSAPRVGARSPGQVVLGLISGCTTAIDTAHAVMAQMGTRFVQVRVESTKRRRACRLGPQAIGTRDGHACGVREAARGLLEHLPGTAHPVDQSITERSRRSVLRRARTLTCRPRRAGRIRLVMDPETPTRLVKMLANSGARRAAWPVACGRLDAVPAHRV